MHINDFDYELPQELIAQTPAEKRDFSRLMVVHRNSGEVEHKHFYDILDYLKAGDCLVLNNSKVLPARLYGRKEGTDANIEFLLIKRIEGDTWETMVRPGKRLKPGDAVSFSDDKLHLICVENIRDFHFNAHIADQKVNAKILSESAYSGKMTREVNRLRQRNRLRC